MLDKLIFQESNDNAGLSQLLAQPVGDLKDSSVNLSKCLPLLHNISYAYLFPLMPTILYHCRAPNSSIVAQVE